MVKDTDGLFIHRDRRGHLHPLSSSADSRAIFQHTRGGGPRQASKATDKPSEHTLSSHTHPLAFGSPSRCSCIRMRIYGDLQRAHADSIKRNAALPARRIHSSLGSIAVGLVTWQSPHTPIVPSASAGGANGIVPAFAAAVSCRATRGFFAFARASRIRRRCAPQPQLMSNRRCQCSSPATSGGSTYGPTRPRFRGATVSKIGFARRGSLGRLIFILTVNTANVINFQLAGGGDPCRPCRGDPGALRSAGSTAGQVGRRLGGGHRPGNLLGCPPTRRDCSQSTYKLMYSMAGWQRLPGFASFHANLVVWWCGVRLLLRCVGAFPRAASASATTCPPAAAV